jgi:hypothetical protein
MSIRRMLSFSRSSEANRRLSSSQSDTSGRPPTYASSVTSAPPYSSHDPNDRVRAWSANLPSLPEILSPDSETVVDGLELETEASLAGGADIEAFGEGTSPTGPGYRMSQSYLLRSLLSHFYDPSVLPIVYRRRIYSLYKTGHSRRPFLRTSQSYLRSPTPNF